MLDGRAPPRRVAWQRGSSGRSISAAQPCRRGTGRLLAHAEATWNRRRPGHHSTRWEEPDDSPRRRRPEPVAGSGGKRPGSSPPLASRSTARLRADPTERVRGSRSAVGGVALRRCPTRTTSSGWPVRSATSRRPGQQCRGALGLAPASTDVADWRGMFESTSIAPCRSPGPAAGLVRPRERAPDRQRGLDRRDTAYEAGLATSPPSTRSRR